MSRSWSRYDTMVYGVCMCKRTPGTDKGKVLPSILKRPLVSSVEAAVKNSQNKVSSFFAFFPQGASKKIAFLSEHVAQGEGGCGLRPLKNYYYYFFFKNRKTVQFFCFFLSEGIDPIFRWCLSKSVLSSFKFLLYTIFFSGNIFDFFLCVIVCWIQKHIYVKKSSSKNAIFFL